MLFGGVHDDEDEDNDEDLCGNFFNDLYQLELDKGKWTQIRLKGPDRSEKKSRRKKKECEEISCADIGTDDSEEEEPKEELKNEDINASVSFISYS